MVGVITLCPNCNSSFGWDIKQTEPTVDGGRRPIASPNCPRCNFSLSSGSNLGTAYHLRAVYNQPLHPSEKRRFGRDKDKVNNGGNTALMVAAICGSNEAAKSFLEAGASVNIKSNSGETALILASKYGHPETVEMLLEYGADVNEHDNVGARAFDRAVIYGYRSCMEKLIAAGFDVNSFNPVEGWTPLIIAISNNRKDCVEFLVAQGADVNLCRNEEYGSSPLSYAFSMVSTELGKFLLEHGAQIDERTLKAALHRASLDPFNTDGVELLLANGSHRLDDLTYEKGTLWHHLAAESSIELLEKIWPDDLSPDIRNDQGKTPLQLACQTTSFGSRSGENIHKTVQFLLGKGADFKIQDSEGNHLLHYCAEQDDDGDLTPMLVGLGIDVNSVNSKGQTALHIASITGSGQTKVCQTLIELQADIEALDSEGDTPLLASCRTGFDFVPALLIKNGASLQAKTPDGLTLLDVARQHPQKDEHVPYQRLIKLLGGDEAAKNIFESQTNVIPKPWWKKIFGV